MSNKIGRKDFIKKVVKAGVATTVFPSILASGSYGKEKLRIGFIGTGLRGQWLLDLASKRIYVDIHAICDIEDYIPEKHKIDFKFIIFNFYNHYSYFLMNNYDIWCFFGHMRSPFFDYRSCVYCPFFW